VGAIIFSVLGSNNDLHIVIILRFLT